MSGKEAWQVVVGALATLARLAALLAALFLRWTVPVVAFAMGDSLALLGPIMGLLRAIAQRAHHPTHVHQLVLRALHDVC